MPPSLFSDDNGNRVIIRHTGPAGKGIPVGGATGQILQKTGATDYQTTWVNPPSGTGAVVGPTIAVNNNVALFDTTTGKLLKDSGVNLGSLATNTTVATKVDKVTGKVLSSEDFTTVLRTKLLGLSPSGYRGTFNNLAAINAPMPLSGDYCTIEVLGTPAVLVVRDALNLTWVPIVMTPVNMTGTAIANVLFDSADALVWDKETCRIFTEAEKATLASHAAIISSLNIIAPVAAYGGVTYYNTSGTALTLTTTPSKVNVVSALTAATTGFDNGTTTSRLRYTGTKTQTFQITANLSFSSTVTGSLSVGIAKNGTVDADSKIVTGTVSTVGAIQTCSTTLLVTLLTNEYIELFINRVAGVVDPTIYTLSLVAVKVS